MSVLILSDDTVQMQLLAHSIGSIQPIQQTHCSHKEMLRNILFAFKSFF